MIELIQTLLMAYGAGSGTSVVVELLKKAQSVDLYPGDTTRIRLVVAAITGVTTLVTAYLNGTLADPQNAEVVMLGVQWIFSFAMSHFSFKAAIK